MTEEDRLNAKYGAFYVSTWSNAVGKYRNLCKSYPTMRHALDAAKRLEGTRRYAGQFLFIDIAH